MAEDKRTITVGRDYIQEVKDHATVITGASIHGDHAQQQITTAQQFAQGITAESSRENVAKLLSMIKETVANSELPEGAKKEVVHELEGAEMQLEKAEPNKPKIASKLKDATEALVESSKTIKAAVDIANMIGKAILWCGVQWAMWKYGT